VEKRREWQLYLCRAELLPDPRNATSWTALYKARCDWSFITSMTVDVETFELILTSGFHHAWDSMPIPQLGGEGPMQAWQICFICFHVSERSL
jgi:hypothetical protein